MSTESSRFYDGDRRRGGGDDEIRMGVNEYFDIRDDELTEIANEAADEEVVGYSPPTGGLDQWLSQSAPKRNPAHTQEA